MKHIIFSIAFAAGLFIDTQSAEAGTLLLLGAEGSPAVSVVSGFQATGLFSSVTYIDVVGSTPSLATLSAYDSIFTWSNSPPASGFGNVLADFYDLGGKTLTLATYAFSSPWSISGRIMTGNYAALLDSGTNGLVSGSIVPVVPLDSIFTGVDLGAVSSFSNGNYAHPNLAAGATLLATDGGGINMIARSANGVVGMNTFPQGGTSEFFELAGRSLLPVAFSPVPVPEPSTAVVSLALIGVGLARRRKQS